MSLVQASHLAVFRALKAPLDTLDRLYFVSAGLRLPLIQARCCYDTRPAVYSCSLSGDYFRSEEQVINTMTFSPLTTTCPACGSKDIVYSCEPACCFNHVCSSCLNSFELLTRDLGESGPSMDMEPEERDPCAPTVACARCKSLNVYMAGENPARLSCASCHAMLELVFSSE
jgi:hypothetical protein